MTSFFKRFVLLSFFVFAMGPSLMAQADQSLVAKANAGDTKAMCTLAFCYERGAGVPLDSAIALQWYQKAAALGDGEAWLRVSRYMLTGTFIKADTNRYFAIRKEWADKGLPNGIAALAIAYYGGYGVKADTAHFVELCQLAASKGSSWGLSTLGDLYSTGDCGFRTDTKKAEQFYKKALKTGDVTVNTDLAYFYARIGDYKNAWRYLTESLRWNDPAARSLESQLYYYGSGVDEDEVKAQQIAERLVADFPSQAANYELASRVFMVANHGRDSVKAIQYLMRGAELGNATCRLRLCSHYCDAGRYDEAMRLLDDVLQSDAGNEEKGSACMAYATLYQYGGGVEQNDDSRVVWLKRGVDRYNSSVCANSLAEYYMQRESSDSWGDNALAVRYLERAIECGDTNALVTLGNLYLQQNKFSDAEKTFGRLLEMGKNDGYYWLALLYSQVPDDAKSLNALKRGDKEGNALCRETLGALYEQGAIGKKTDYKRAEKYYLLAATPRSYDNLGRMYLNGNLGKQEEKDVKKGLAYIEDAANRGYIDAIYHMGYIYETGSYVEVDHVKALSYYKLLADNGVAMGFFKMGLYYELGDGGVEADSTKAIEYYTKAAEMGHGEAMCYLGDFYRIGQFLPLDRTKAFEYYVKADSVGEEIGTYYVGRSYLEGCGVGIDSAAAIPYLKAAAAAGVGRAAFLLAEFYNYGKGSLGQDGDSASHYYVMGHNNGSGEASYYVGASLINEGHAKDGVSYLYTGAQRGNVDALVLYALCRQEGLGIEADAKDAYSILDYVAHGANHPAAYYYLGLARLNGEGCVQSESLGKCYLDTAAMLGNVKAMSTLGVCYLNGYGCQRDTVEAVRCYRNAIEAGSLDACNRLGYLYEAQENYDSAVACYRKSMEGGNLEGYCCLGLCYEKGRGVILSYKRAYELYKAAADAGYGRGYVMLAFCYLEGINVEADPVEALRLFEKGGEAGNVIGMYNAGSLLEDGEDGVQRDMKRAKYWYSQAAARGYEPALEALKRMK